MSYAHYWSDNTWREPISATALRVIKKLSTEAFRAGIIQRGHDDPRPPMVTATELRFNGVGGRGHETFLFQTDGPDPFGFCKTARKPYDDLVMRILLVLGSHRPGFEITSDGAFDHEWIEALDWFNQTVGRAYIQDRIFFEMPGLDEPQTIYRLSF